MALPLALEPIPLFAAEDGRALRVIGTRVNLETLIGAYKEGSTPEEIAEDFSAVSLADVYAVIAYYLRHRDEVEDYMQECAAESDEAEQELIHTFDHGEFRKRLVARRREGRTGPG